MNAPTHLQYSGVAASPHLQGRGCKEAHRGTTDVAGLAAAQADAGAGGGLLRPAEPKKAGHATANAPKEAGCTAAAGMRRQPDVVRRYRQTEKTEK